LETWAFTAKSGSLSHATPTEAGWYVYEILDRLPAGLRSLGQARTFIRERVIQSLQIGQGMDAAAQARAAILAGAKEADVAKRYHGTVAPGVEVTRSGYILNLDEQSKVVGALYATPLGSWSP